MALKVMLGNGWYQEVTVNNEDEQVIRYMKGRIEDDVVNMDMSSLTNMGLMMNDIQHKLIMINNLLHHELKELKGNYNDANELKQQLYKYEVIEEKENTPNSKNQG